MPMERDEDQILDEAYERKIKTGDTSDWTQDDHDFAKLAGEIFDQQKAKADGKDAK